jgi:hypothetical protein
VTDRGARDLESAVHRYSIFKLPSSTSLASAKRFAEPATRWAKLPRQQSEPLRLDMNDVSSPAQLLLAWTDLELTEAEVQMVGHQKRLHAGI